MFWCTDPFLAAAEDQEGLDAVLLQIRIPLTSKTRFHLIVSIKILQGGLSDVDPPAKRQKDFHIKPASGCVIVFYLPTLLVYAEHFGYVAAPELPVTLVRDFRRNKLYEL